mmetsp:Transcript_27202/g.81573  ORF Transcript_27202/g.81573 Transcript_27202/m.81573 type:complete len:465 (+) Transcript_27202:197-1591(+)
MLRLRSLARRGLSSLNAWDPATQTQRAGAVAAAGAALDVDFYQFSFVDLFGVQRSKLVPASRVVEMAEAGAGFGGFAAWLDQDPSMGDLLAMPDPQSLAPLPWNPRVAWLACDLVWEGEELDQGPRNVLRRTLRALEARGLAMKTGVECEFFLVDPEGEGVADARDGQTKPCYDAHALMRRFDVISELVEAMEALGWGPYQADHEDGNGQFEINWDFADALATADRVVFFKYMARSVAERHGLRATFMAKPFQALTGSGCHAHVSLHDPPSGRNLCGGAGALGLGDDARKFVAGVLAEARAASALTNPTVNSYKRLNARGTSSGATWSPNAATWSGNNRSALIRVPDDKRFEVRLADMSANPYLHAAGIAAAGLAGLDSGEEPPAPAVGNLFDASDPAVHALVEAAPQLPSDLGEALAALDGSPALREHLGGGFVDAYLKLKRAHWAEYQGTVTAWERDQYLDV